MTIRLSSNTRSVLANALVDLIDGGSSAAGGFLALWSGSRPSAVTDAPAGTKLAEFAPLPNPCFGNASNGVATANAISDEVGIAAGTIGFVRVSNRDGTALWDNDNVGTSAGFQVQLNTLSVAVDVAVSVTSWTMTQPAEG